MSAKYHVAWHVLAATEEAVYSTMRDMVTAAHGCKEFDVTVKPVTRWHYFALARVIAD